MSIDTAVITRVKDSFARCSGKDGFLEAFYEGLFASLPEAKPKFENTLFSVQKALVNNGMKKLFAFAGGDAAAKTEMDLIQESHNRSHLDIRPDWYTHFIGNMVKTAAKFDPEFSTDLESDWRSVMQPGIDHIKAGH